MVQFPKREKHLFRIQVNSATRVFAPQDCRLVLAFGGRPDQTRVQALSVIWSFSRPVIQGAAIIGNNDCIRSQTDSMAGLLESESCTVRMAAS